MRRTIKPDLTVRRPGIQQRVSRQLRVDPSLVSKIARNLYHPVTARGAMVVARVNIALARERRCEPGHVVTCDPAFHGGLVE